MVKVSAFKKLAVILTLGNALYAAAVTFFIVPSGIILGGFTGLSVALHHFTGIKLLYFVILFHLSAYILGAFVLGKNFAVSTAASLVLYPLFLAIFEWLTKYISMPLLDSLMINTIISAILIGIGLGILTRSKTSTGGTEILPLVFNKLTGRPIGSMLLIIDGSIMLLQTIYSDSWQIVCGLVMVALYSIIVQFCQNERFLMFN